MTEAEVRQKIARLEEGHRVLKMREAEIQRDIEAVEQKLASCRKEGNAMETELTEPLRIALAPFIANAQAVKDSNQLDVGSSTDRWAFSYSTKEYLALLAAYEGKDD